MQYNRLPISNRFIYCFHAFFFIQSPVCIIFYLSCSSYYTCFSSIKMSSSDLHLKSILFSMLLFIWSLQEWKRIDVYIHDTQIVYINNLSLRKKINNNNRSKKSGKIIIIEISIKAIFLARWLDELNPMKVIGNHEDNNKHFAATFFSLSDITLIRI